MEPAQNLYNQAATHFSMRIFIRPGAGFDGELMVELAERFRASLLFPGIRLTELDTKRPGMGAKLNSGEFSDRRWTATVKKLRANQYAVLWLRAQSPDFSNQKIWLSIHVNPPGGDEHVGAETVHVSCSVSYLRHLAASPDKVEALLKLGTIAWNRAGQPAYGYGNLAISPRRPTMLEWAQMPAGTPFPGLAIHVPAERPHPVPIAYVGDVDLNLEGMYASGRGIKGAFWANFLTADHVAMVGGESALRAQLPGVHIDALDRGGLLLVATDSPLPADSELNHARFVQLDTALKPAYLSREATSENKRQMLGYFYRERS